MKGAFQFIAYWFLRLGLYRLKSNVYRWLFERRFRAVPVSPVKSVDELLPRLPPSWWRADSFAQAWDAVSYPGRVQSFINRGFPPARGFDCDEFAIYSSAVISQSWPGAPVYFLTVLWLEGWKIVGHNVCAYYTRAGYSFVDYREIREGFLSLKGIAYDVAFEFGGPDCTPLAFAAHRLDLTPEVVERLG